ncbi:MAG: hypothetical protein HOP03_12710 [Lysobacter sp.]|nr:hypothetical protein [Lysobacter sp.]
MHTRHRIFLVAGLAAALVATTAISAPRMARGDAMLPPTATELGLSKVHATSWDALRADAVALRQLGRDDLQDGFVAFRSLLDQPTPDLRAFSEESQRKVDAHMAEARALRDRQLDLYESLSTDEQARVRAAMAARLDRFAALRERLAGFMAPRS